MAFTAYPPSLVDSTWQKAKSALVGKTGIGAKLKELQAAHGKIVDGAFEPKNGLKTNGELDDWQKAVDPQVALAAKFVKLLTTFNQFATTKAAELKKSKTCPSKTRELVEKMAATAKQTASEVAEFMKQIDEKINEAQESLAEADLAGQLKASKSSPRNFVVVVGKTPGLVVTKLGIGAKQRQSAKDLAGGSGSPIDGTVTVEDSTYVFTIDVKPSNSLARQIKKAISLQAGLNAKVRVRGDGLEVDDAEPPPPSGALPPTPPPTGLSPNQENLRKLAINHGPMDRAAAEKYLENAPAGSWMLRFSANQKQSVVSRKTAKGFEHFLSMPEGKDLDLSGLVSSYKLNSGSVVRPGDTFGPQGPTDSDVALKSARAKVQQLLDLCAKDVKTVGPAYVGQLMLIQANMQKAILKTDAAEVLSDFDKAKKQYIDLINRAKKSTVTPSTEKKLVVKAKIKKEVFFEKDSTGESATPYQLSTDDTYLAKLASTHGITTAEAKEIVGALLDELINETQALLPKGFKKPHGKQNTINPTVPEQSRPKLTLEEAKAVFSYSTNDYKLINPPLWSGKVPPPPHDKTHLEMQKAFAKCKPFDVPLKVTRGLNFASGPDTDNFLKKFKDAAGTDNLVPLTGYISTGTTGTPSDFKGNIEFVIIAKQGLDLQPYTEFPNEKELLLDHNTPVKVHSVKQSGNKWTVTVEQILPTATI